MNPNSMILALLASLSLAGATAGTAQAQEASAPTRGTVQVQGKAARAIVAGPVAIRAYSAFSGATPFVVNAVSGTDRDCAGAPPRARARASPPTTCRPSWWARDRSPASRRRPLTQRAALARAEGWRRVSPVMIALEPLSPSPTSNPVVFQFRTGGS